MFGLALPAKDLIAILGHVNVIRQLTPVRAVLRLKLQSAQLAVMFLQTPVIVLMILNTLVSAVLGLVLPALHYAPPHRPGDALPIEPVRPA